MRVLLPKSARNRKVGVLGRFVKTGATLKMKDLEKPEIGKYGRKNGSYLWGNRISSVTQEGLFPIFHYSPSCPRSPAAKLRRQYFFTIAHPAPRKSRLAQTVYLKRPFKRKIENRPKMTPPPCTVRLKFANHLSAKRYFADKQSRATPHSQKT